MSGELAPFDMFKRVPQCPVNSKYDAQAGGCVCNKPNYAENPNTHASCVPVVIVDNTRPPKTPKTCVGNPIYPLTGAKSEFVRTGVMIGGVELTLTYDSTPRLPASQQDAVSLAEANAFGPLWLSSLHHKLQVSPTGKSALLSRGDGLIINFTGNGAGAFTANPGGRYALSSITGGYRFSDMSSGAIETFDAAGKLLSIETASGPVLSFTYNGQDLVKVLANEGRAVVFRYGSNGLVSEVIASDSGTMTVGYDAAKNLSSLGFPDGKTQTFLYENTNFPWALTGKVDENSSRYATFVYDEHGRAISSEHAGEVQKYSIQYGGVMTQSVVDVFDAAANIIYRTFGWPAPVGTAVTRPNGQSIAMEAQLVNGAPALTAQSQPAGSGCGASLNAVAYDSDGNTLSNDDFQGNRTCYAYDANKREILRVEGLPNTTACASVLSANATLPTGARKVSTSWHADWGLATQVRQPLRRTHTIYHGQPDPLNGNSAANCTSAAVRSDGKALPVVCKRVEQATLDTGAVGSPVTDDPYLDKVVLLLHGNGANNSVSVVDDSLAGRSVTLVGNTKISTAQSKFGGASIAFDGAGDYISVPYSSDFAFGSGDFTIETFLYKNTNNPNASRIWNPNGDYLDALTLNIDASGNFAVYASTNGTAWTHSLPVVANLANGQWYHLAVVRSGGSLYAFVNGTRYTVTTALGSTALYSNASYPRVIGGQAGVNRGLDGYIEDFRITKGVARYTANFTVPSQQAMSGSLVGASISRYSYDGVGRVLNSVDANSRTTTFAYYTNSAFSGGNAHDPHIANVAFLSHANGADNSTSITDDSTTNRWISALGNAKISTAQSKFGGASIAFDGNGDYLTAPYGDDLDFGGDFTIESFVYLTAHSSPYAGAYGAAIVSRYLAGTANAGWQLRINGTASAYTTINVYTGVTDLNVTGLSIGLNTWHHVAVARSGSTLRVFLNGAQVGSFTNAESFTRSAGSPLYIGSLNDATYKFYMPGYIDELRITKGIARYTANFTPPAQEFANTGPDASALGHTIGDLASVTNAAGYVTQFDLYDPGGRLRRMTDAKGVVTDITYTPRGWVSTVVVTPPGGAARTTTYTYDFVGQLTGVSNPDGTSLAYSYDAAHRLVGVTDARGNVITYTLDNTGNRIAEEVRDPTGTLQRAIGRSFDALNRLQQVTGAAQ